MDNYAETFESFEADYLAPYAIKASHSKGRAFQEEPSYTRTCFQRDRDRIVHSKAFRRLREKTQVFVSTESDHYRSRLTHSLEVAQISRHLARLLKLNEDLTEAIALAHDLGHTPFGHAGETVLNKCMEAHGGFEHNLQSLRIVQKLEKKYPLFEGLNLSFEVEEGLKKHQTPFDAPDVADDVFLSLEAQVVNLADQITYNNHDIDDGLCSALISDSDLYSKVTLWQEASRYVKENYTHLDDDTKRSLCISYLISKQIADVVATSKRHIKIYSIQSIDDVQKHSEAVVCFSKEMEEKAAQLRHYLFEEFYTHPKVYRMNKKGQHIIEGLFNHFVSDTKLLPKSYQQQLESKESVYRICADYVSGMTDPYAEKVYYSLF